MKKLVLICLVLATLCLPIMAQDCDSSYKEITESSRSALNKAIVAGDVECVEYFLRTGSRIDKNNNKPLILAITSEKEASYYIVSMLAEYGINMTKDMFVMTKGNKEKIGKDSPVSQVTKNAVFDYVDNKDLSSLPVQKFKLLLSLCKEKFFKSVDSSIYKDIIWYDIVHRNQDGINFLLDQGMPEYRIIPYVEGILEGISSAPILSVKQQEDYTTCKNMLDFLKQNQKEKDDIFYQQLQNALYNITKDKIEKYSSDLEQI